MNIQNENLSTLSILRFTSVVRHLYWVFLVFTFCLVGATYIFLKFKTPSYRATASFIIDRKLPRSSIRWNRYTIPPTVAGLQMKTT